MYIVHVHTNYRAHSCVVNTQPLMLPLAKKKLCPLEKLDLLSVAAVEPQQDKHVLLICSVSLFALLNVKG